MLAGVVYAAVLGFGLVTLRLTPDHGFEAMIVLFAVVWGTDTGAFFAGRLIGGPKLWPRVSPKKTWAGAVGGLAAGIAAGLLASAVLDLPVGGALFLVSAVLSVASQAGDLFESCRQAPVRRQGFRPAHSRPRRADGPGRRPHIRGRAGGGDRLPARRGDPRIDGAGAMVSLGATAMRRPVAAPALRRITILGATGSIGGSTLEVIAARPDAYAVEAVTAEANAAKLADIARKVGARFAAVADPSRYDDLKEALAGTGIEAAAGEAAVVEAAARPADLVVAAIVGAAGLAPTYAAVTAGTRVALANKECLVSAGDVFVRAARRRSVAILPVDSEHNAIFQILDRRRMDDVERIVITASGGPFRDWSLACHGGRDAG